jgi:threonine dehydrogenase-like Zn-dependent dehydrogenase
MPIEQALLIEPYSCSKHCVDRAAPTNEDVVVLSGVGTLGLGMVGGLRKRNPKLLIALDMNDVRLAKAKAFGADMVMNPGKEDVVKKVKDLTGGYGCDIYIEASGHPSSVQQGLDMIRKMGRFVEFSVFGSPVTVDWSIISDRKELDLLGVHLSPYSYDSVIQWIGDGTMPTDGVVSHKFPLEQWQTGFEYAATGKDNSFKVALIP